MFFTINIKQSHITINKIITPNIVAIVKNTAKYTMCIIKSFIKLTMSTHPPTLIEPFCISIL